MELVKTLLCTQLKPANQENRFHISAESPKEGFKVTIFQHLIEELKHCKLGVQTDIKLVPVFLCLYSVCLVVMLPFRMIFFHNVFSFISFPQEFAVIVPCYKIYLLFYLVSIRIFKITFKVEMSKEKIYFIKRNENNCNFYKMAYFVYYKCF